MIEWGNAWAKGITYRREFNQDVVIILKLSFRLYLGRWFLFADWSALFSFSHMGISFTSIF